MFTRHTRMEFFAGDPSAAAQAAAAQSPGLLEFALAAALHSAVPIEAEALCVAVGLMPAPQLVAAQLLPCWFALDVGLLLAALRCKEKTRRR